VTPDEMLEQFVQLEKDRRMAEDALDGIKQQLTALQEPLQEHFMAQGIQHIRVGGLTVYLETKPKVRPRDGKDKVIEALRNTGHDELVKVDYHWSQLNALVKNYMADGADLPTELAEAVEVVDEYAIRTRRAS